MRARRLCVTAIVAGVLAWVIPAVAQLGRPGDWTTSGYDAQRSFWVRSDPKISVSSVQTRGMQFLWKMKLGNSPRQLNSLTEPMLMDRLIGYKGFRSLGFVAGSADKVFVLDTDLARTEWERQLPSAPHQTGSIECPGGLTSAMSRVTGLAIAPPPATAAGSGGRGSPAKSGVGQAGQGAVTLAEVNARRAPARVTPAQPAPETAPYALAIRRGAIPAYVLSSTGMLHMLNSQNGSDIVEPFKFLPANANATGLIVLETVAYAATTAGCGGVADGVWALDLAGGRVSNWKTEEGIAGTAGFALGPDGTAYVATRGGELVALEAEDLKQKASFRAGNPFTSSPVVFEHKGRTLVAAATNDGRIHVLDTAGMGSLAAQSAAIQGNFGPGALASWQDSTGTRWLLSPTDEAIVALKLVDRNGTLAFEPGWTSRELVAAVTPAVMNGVVFALSSGEFRTSDNKVTAAQRAQRSSPAVLYALDGATGKELWNSGKTMSSFAHRGGLSGNGGQLYVGTYDGTLYAFGFPMEH
jgi:outer membrane protein assembly factor BamB